MFSGIHPLARILTGLSLDDFYPMLLYGCPFAINIVTSLVLDSRQPIAFHIAGEEFLVILWHTGFKYENTRGDAYSEEQIFRQFDDFLQPMLLKDAFLLLLAGLFQFLVRMMNAHGVCGGTLSRTFSTMSMHPYFLSNGGS